MMGLLFSVFAAGIMCGIILCVVRSWRRHAPFALVPILASVGSLTFCWGLAAGLERLFASQRVGGIGFFGGYVLGGLLGAGVGIWLALGLTRRFGPPNISFEADGSAAAQLNRYTS